MADSSQLASVAARLSEVTQAAVIESLTAIELPDPGVELTDPVSELVGAIHPPDTLDVVAISNWLVDRESSLLLNLASRHVEAARKEADRGQTESAQTLSRQAAALIQQALYLRTKNVAETPLIVQIPALGPVEALS